MLCMSTGTIWQTRSTDSEETEELGRLLGRQLQLPEVIELVSDLGGGKTTFVKGLAAGVGSKDRVASPTFTLSKIYKAKDVEIHHFDFYRLSEPGVVSDQLQESLEDPKVITVIEWSDIVKGVLPGGRLTIHFRPVASNSDEREIEINYPESKAEIIEKVRSQMTEVKP